MKLKVTKKILSQIPKGLYCHGQYKHLSNGRVSTPDMCPFWSKNFSLPPQENGYCSLLNKGDYEINREICTLIETRFKNGKAIKRSIKCGPANPSFLSLLWDQVKECGLNNYTEKEILKEIKKGTQ